MLGLGQIMINCYTPDVVNKTSPTGCTGDPLPSVAAKSKLLPRSCMPAVSRLH